MSNSTETIPQALGISDEWVEKNEKAIIDLIKGDMTYLSDVIVAHAKDIKADEFGDESASDLSAYEKKLFWSGMEVAKIVIAAREASKKAESGLEELMKMLSDMKASHEKGE